MKRQVAYVLGSFFAAIALIAAAAPSVYWGHHPEAPAELKAKLSK